MTRTSQDQTSQDRTSPYGPPGVTPEQNCSVLLSAGGYRSHPVGDVL